MITKHFFKNLDNKYVTTDIFYENHSCGFKDFEVGKIDSIYKVENLRGIVKYDEIMYLGKVNFKDENEILLTINETIQKLLEHESVNKPIDLGLNHIEKLPSKIKVNKLGSNNYNKTAKIKHLFRYDGDRSQSFYEIMEVDDSNLFEINEEKSTFLIREDIGNEINYRHIKYKEYFGTIENGKNMTEEEYKKKITELIND